MNCIAKPSASACVCRSQGVALPSQATRLVGKAASSSSAAAAVEGTPLFASSRLSILPRLAACVEVEAAASRFEYVSGRAAMTGVSAALIAEAVLGNDIGLFNSLAVSCGPLGVAVFLGLSASIGALLALGTREVAGADVQEEVVCSLTSSARSTSVAQVSVDKLLDYVLDQSPSIGFDAKLFWSMDVEESQY